MTDSSPRFRVKKAHPIMIYGSQGLGKTTLIAEIARHLGLPVRLYTAEHYDSIQDAIDEGIVEVWKVNTRPHPFETLRAAADGYWPADPLDPTSPLVAPTKETFIKYPIRAYEGMGTYCGYLTSNQHVGGLLWRVGQGETFGDMDFHVQLTDGEESVGGMNWTLYGLAQREIVGLVQRSQKWPGYMIWTSHVDDGKKHERIMGPETIGAALTGNIGREFADVWHISSSDTVYVQDNVPRLVTDRYLYLKNHVLVEGGHTYLSRNSVPFRAQSTVPERIAMTKNGQPRLDIAEKLFSVLNRRSIASPKTQDGTEVPAAEVK
jgi:hypothetical protein